MKICLGTSANTLFYVIFIIYRSVGDTSNDPCPDATNITPVTSCPTNVEEWNTAKEKKNCTHVQHNCLDDNKSPVYHCVLSKGTYEFVDLCAPVWQSSGFCVVFNPLMGRIEDDYTKNCKEYMLSPCPDVYKSVDVYKYPGCRNSPSGGNQQSDGEITLPSTTYVNTHAGGEDGNQLDFLEKILVVCTGILSMILVALVVSIYRHETRAHGNGRDAYELREVPDHIEEHQV
ncbi:uncharacterized protein LOC125677158 [Ostrea edulis]|uniref:uncharacterized protein LOC125677158 n=1 Tax=Ostrea edulis TaxID=37623 RepID=UPI0024AF113B|nr:uncharacterized protein LOC125677158 [Ostrea edulis]XP_048771090.2 uncharacterized protein LOC125677158 [Ostrea edulis]